MKKLLLLFILSLGASAGFAQAPAESFILKDAEFSFGKIPQGKPVFHSFELVNTAKDTLVITNVQASCGCTTPEWDHNGIAPGATSIIRVGYNAAAEGIFTKTVTVSANGLQKIIVISGSVFRAPATSAPLNTSVSLLKNTNQ